MHPGADTETSTPFAAPTRCWFQAAFSTPTEVQRRGWECIGRGENALLVAPTGSGKTLAAFLWAIDRLTSLPSQTAPAVRVLYVSPLKALVYDVERNLRGPLIGIAGLAAEGQRAIQVDVRTGDTPQSERRRQQRHPADILVTTPESLFLLLGSKARDTLRGVETVIVDEVHALAGSKRGAHLALSLERLEELATAAPQRVGLSATVRPVEAVARYLAGERPITIVDAGSRPRLDLEVVVPVADMERPAPDAKAPPERGGPVLGALLRQQGPSPERGIWAALYPRLLREIRAARSTILFVNSRGLCERLAQRLNELAEEPLVLAHHGSLSHARRAEIEDRLKRGQVRCLVATSSLELGVDMGAVDQVLLVESPGSVTRGIQRVGRAGHRVGEVSRGRVFPKFRGDLLECAVVTARMLSGEIEAIGIPRNPLDVLAQQLTAMCCDRPRSPEELGAVARRAWPYRELSDDALTRVLDMLSGRYTGSGLADLRPLLSWDRQRDLLSPRRGTPMLVRLNGGTIPDRGNYGVYVAPDGPRVGELDEEMVFETRAGEAITLGASTWRVEEITRDRVLVSPAPGEAGKLPFWHGDGPGRPLELGLALGAFLGQIQGLSGEQAKVWLRSRAPLDALAAHNLAAYLDEQRALTGTLPSDRIILVERFRDELGDWRICILSPLGARVHAPWAMALQRALETRAGFEVQVMYTDDGIALRVPDGGEHPSADSLFPEPETVQDLITEQLADSALFAGLFRENAARALLMPRRTGRERQPLWAQRLKAQQLLAVARRYPDFPIVVETYRQCLSDRFDVPGLRRVLGDVRSRRIRVVEVATPHASPFARSLVFAYVAAFIYGQDAPLAERKAQALTLDRRLLGELLGQEELRTLIDPAVLAELEAELQHLPPGRRARDADELHDLLRRLGDLDPQELGRRCAADPLPWLEDLRRQQRAVAVRVAGQRRWIAAEDAGLYRDAVGSMPPGGLPEAFLAPVTDALSGLLQRYARGRGPFEAADPARRFGLRPAQVEPALRLMEHSGRLLWGEIRPGGCAPEWCDPEVFRHLKRRTLARLRHQVAPVDSRALGRFLAEWQGLDRKDGGSGQLLEAVRLLAGLALPWSDLSRRILPARVPGFSLEDLDLLCATGALVWVGRGALGMRDGRIALYPRDQAARLLGPSPADPPQGPVHQTLLQQLQARGACFLLELIDAVQDAHPGLPSGELEAALWDLVWEGRVTNDTFAPLRALSGPGSGRRGRARTSAPAGGRWSLVERLGAGDTTATETGLAQVWMLLGRYGVVSREVVAAEAIPGGFAALYALLRELEQAGRVRRGFFVEGLSGAQFAHPGAVERLRACREDVDGAPAETRGPRLLCATDPASPYGGILPWPDPWDAAANLRRAAGAWLVLEAGRPSLFLAPGGRRIQTFAEEQGPAALASALALLQRLPGLGRPGRLTIEQIDGEPAGDSRLRPLLLAAGFVPDYRGLVLEKRFA